VKKEEEEYRISVYPFKPHRTSFVEHRTARQEAREVK
jgi:hypothetical protein